MSESWGCEFTDDGDYGKLLSRSEDLFENDNLRFLPLEIVESALDKKYIAEIINNLSDYKVNIDLLDTQLGNSYCGRKNNLGLNFDGLEISIKNIYERYLNEKFIN